VNISLTGQLVPNFSPEPARIAKPAKHTKWRLASSVTTPFAGFCAIGSWH
jgi:hypothetical protein